jgi:glycosyltransferase involved in cell wall biosynthesis
MLYRRSRFLVVSEATKGEVERIHAIPGSAIDVVYPGVDSEFFQPAAKSQEPTMIFLGRLKAYKRVETLLDVVSAIDGLTLDLVGDGNHGPELKAEVAARGLGDRVRFHGHVDEQTKKALLSRSWLAATASAAEGWSSATLEAAASGTPTVAHPVGGLRESIVNGQTGFHGETLDELVAATQRLVDDEPLRTRLSVQARARAEVLSWERSARGTLEVLQVAAGQRTAAPPAILDPRDGVAASQQTFTDQSQ